MGGVRRIGDDVQPLERRRHEHSSAHPAGDEPDDQLHVPSFGCVAHEAETGHHHVIYGSVVLQRPVVLEIALEPAGKGAVRRKRLESAPYRFPSPSWIRVPEASPKETPPAAEGRGSQDARTSARRRPGRFRGMAAPRWRSEESTLPLRISWRRRSLIALFFVLLYSMRRIIRNTPHAFQYCLDRKIRQRRENDATRK